MMLDGFYLLLEENLSNEGDVLVTCVIESEV
jgi:hypothetical protein